MYDQQKLQGLPIITLRVCPFESLFPCHFSTIFFNNTTYAFLGSVIIRKTLQILVTSRKRSLGQGNIFTPVCHSVHRGGGVGTPPGPGTPPSEQCMLGDTGNKRAVRILLECILVSISFFCLFVNLFGTALI